MSRARRRSDEAKIEARMERVIRDAWHWRMSSYYGPRARNIGGEWVMVMNTDKDAAEEMKRDKDLAKKLAHNPKACGGHCCNWTDEVKGQRKREYQEMRTQLEA